ncbi:trna delta -isopentenylpyrophosphate transferase [Antarcticirhabdus aurantiaca]|uniref:Trna delta -isopentenylpyrophosphate transferase n=1 Tax=Antarcticirhabdus aurantiaca TaxID=2606717 RepID=A0ACD4NI30_9HYPH|nr:trna delta -isopentenylpyrophosphate transferase [Antarcticirhabdus aurantiaca]WAJ26419.1 trna delta -isopentenylpyrophosphate transferase [Jeongeuplla avenae]
MSSTSSTADKQISDTLAKYGEPFAGNVWRVQGNAVIYHKALERIAAQADIRYDKPTILRAERDEAVILVSGTMGERSEWSIGEALVDVNYRVSGRQAAYVYAMAEKRAKDRVILKLINLHGLVYSEEEADEFKENRPSAVAARAANAPKLRSAPIAAEGETENEGGVALKSKIDAAKTINAVTDLMLDAETQKALGELPQGLRDEVRDHAKARLVALGWPTKKAA